VLLRSSFSMVLAERAGQLGRRKQIMVFLVLTLILGMVFLGVKVTSGTRSSRSIIFPDRRSIWKAPVSRTMPNCFFRCILR
jgi:heme/copper-type cytochrome/quinol oxidase subunit 3